MRLNRCGDLNTPSIENFLVKDDDGCMPRSDASVDLATARSHERGYHMPSICLPTSCVDMALTMQLLSLYTYSFTKEGMSVMESVAEEACNIYCAVHESAVHENTYVRGG